ncbi:hypothetical protein [Crenobacter caeni]|uniref:Uncharacterized protein n=1 Tax=Crenobacter caeni TaxID=2705474 RepID=A0A6B2KUS7_9NEIS|nr:hypothetical protein [Crenobacter caeni]NDV13763.1 hypothetical protein [Crenobacter caeni]
MSDAITVLADEMQHRLLASTSAMEKFASVFAVAAQKQRDGVIPTDWSDAGDETIADFMAVMNTEPVGGVVFGVLLNLGFARCKDFDWHRRMQHLAEAHALVCALHREFDDQDSLRACNERYTERGARFTRDYLASIRDDGFKRGVERAKTATAKKGAAGRDMKYAKARELFFKWWDAQPAAKTDKDKIEAFRREHFKPANDGGYRWVEAEVRMSDSEFPRTARGWIKNRNK